MNYLTTELLNVLNSDRNSLVEVGCLHYEDRFYAIFKMLRHGILNGEKNLLIIDRSDIDLVNEILSHTDFNEFLIMLDNGIIQEKDWYRIKSIGKKKKISNSDPSFEILKYKYFNYREKLNVFCTLSKKKLFGDKTYKDLSKLADKSAELFSPDYIQFRLDNSLFDFNEQEFWSLKKDLEEASILYDTSFLSLDQTNIISDSTYKMISDKDDIKHVVTTLNEFKVHSEKLLKEYYEFVSSYYFSESKKIDLSLTTVLGMVDQLLEKIQIDEISKKMEVEQSNHFGFRKSKRNLQHFFDDYYSLLAECEQSNCIDLILLDKFKLNFGKLKDLEQVLIDLKVHLNHQMRKIDEVVTDRYKRINSQNYSSDTPTKLNNEVDLFFKSLNDVGFWSQDVENNTLSVQQQLKQLEKVNVKLLSTINFLKENGAFVFWKSIVHQMNDKSKSIINSLTLVQKSEWINAMVSWYLNQLLKNNFGKISIDEKLFNNYLDISSELYNEEIRNFRDILNNQQIEQYHLLKKKNKSYYNSNFKKLKPSNSRYIYHFTESIEFIQSVFPICILAMDNLELIPSKLLSTWDSIHICSKQVPNILPDDKLIYHYVVSREGEIGQNLIQYNYKSISGFNTMTTRQQLEPAKELARRLVNVNPNYLVLKVVDKKYIISLVSELELNQYIQQSEHNIVKSYNTSGNQVDNITDMILASEEDYELILLIDNIIIKFDNLESLEWQHTLLNDYRKAGFKVVSVNDVSLKLKKEPMLKRNKVVTRVHNMEENQIEGSSL